MKLLYILGLICVVLWGLAVTLEERSNKRD